MILNVISNFIAFILGFAATITGTYNSLSHLPLELQIITNPPTDTVSFFSRSIVAGIIALSVKVGGDMIVTHLKDRKKNGKS